jgi:hypothetical protein
MTREIEITSVIAESATSCRTRNDPVRPVLPMSVAIMSKAFHTSPELALGTFMNSSFIFGTAWSLPLSTTRFFV